MIKRRVVYRAPFADGLGFEIPLLHRLDLRAAHYHRTLTTDGDDLQNNRPCWTPAETDAGCPSRTAMRPCGDFVPTRLPTAVACTSAHRTPVTRLGMAVEAPRADEGS